jgi:hypothetical protein
VRHEGSEAPGAPAAGTGPRRAPERGGHRTGVSVFADEAEVSVRDLATLMLTVSDNAATAVRWSTFIAGDIRRVSEVR